MANCAKCGNLIGRGQRYIGARYKHLSFCSQECYENYISEKEIAHKEPMPDLRLLTDYLKSVYPYNPNWAAVVKQIKSMQKEYGLTCKDMYLVVKYAIEYCDHKVDGNYLLGQFFPKYTEEALSFANEIKQNKQLAKDWQPQEEVVKIKIPKKKLKVPKENCDWGDLN